MTLPDLSYIVAQIPAMILLKYTDFYTSPFKTRIKNWWVGGIPCDQGLKLTLPFHRELYFPNSGQGCVASFDCKDNGNVKSHVMGSLQKASSCFS